MKIRITAVITLFFLTNLLHSQEIPTLGKLYDISEKLGVIYMVKPDTTQKAASQADLNYQLNDREMYLLKAAEFYIIKDYANANLYLTRSRTNFRNKDLINLSFVLLIGSYSNLREIRLAAKYLYVAIRKRQLYPENMKLIRVDIIRNFSRSDFDDALSPYFYYHDRQRILQEIYPN